MSAHTDDAPLVSAADPALRERRYQQVRVSIDALIADETDWVSAMATVACELHHAFDYYHWTGFYRVVAPRQLAVGPYQGGHGCLRIAFERGVCGAAARSGQTQLVPDVERFEGHIACSGTTRSEIVVPIVDPDGLVLAVLDVDSDEPAAFTDVDARHLEALCSALGERYSAHARAQGAQ